MAPEERSTYLANEARACDPDRYLCALLGPAARRDALFGLILFNHELARIPDVVTQPVAGLIRYQWWRDAIDEIMTGRPPRQHPVVIELARTIGRGWVDAAALLALIDAREPALGQAVAGDPADVERFVAATSGSLQRLTYATLGGLEPWAAEAAGELGTAFGLVGILRAVAHEVLERPRSGSGAPAPTDPAGGEAGLISALAARSDELQRRGRQRAGRPRREHMAAFLPAALARNYLKQLRAAGNDPSRAAALRRPTRMPIALAARMLLRRP